MYWWIMTTCSSSSKVPSPEGKAGRISPNVRTPCLPLAEEETTKGQASGFLSLSGGVRV
jgi:hypothetical protein